MEQSKVEKKPTPNQSVHILAIKPDTTSGTIFSSIVTSCRPTAIVLRTLRRFRKHPIAEERTGVLLSVLSYTFTHV
jgi:hypothetical protein